MATSENEFVELTITSSKLENVIGVQKKFNRNITILKLKEKLELITGADTNTMKIQLYNTDNTFLDDLNINSAILGSYPIEKGCRIHIIDDYVAEATCHSDLEKFVLPEEKYNARVDTLRNYMKIKKCGRYSDDYINRVKPSKQQEDMLHLANININDRCVVGLTLDESIPQCKATVMFKGEVEGKPGILIGVKHDKPVGDNNGTYEGKTYFNCDKDYGEFVQPEFVHCGDYPENKIDEHDDEI